MNTGKILIGLSLVMVAVAMIISPSNAAVPDASCMTCPQGRSSPRSPARIPAVLTSAGFLHTTSCPQGPAPVIRVVMTRLPVR